MTTRNKGTYIQVPCSHCGRLLDRTRARAEGKIYCNAQEQMAYEYNNDVRDKKTITLKANQTLKDRTLKRWREGNPRTYVGKRGYRLICTPHGEKFEHHLVWSAHNAGVQVPTGWVVHHKNLDKLDNRIENLVMMPGVYHLQLHNAIRGRNEKGQFNPAI